MIRGFVRGTNIELESETGYPDGQEVVVSVSPVTNSGEMSDDECLQRAFGGWRDDAEELGDFLAWSRRQRQSSRMGPEQ